MTAIKGVVSHHAREVAELRADRELAVEYLKAAMADLDSPEDRGACLVALRTVAEAYGGLAEVASAAMAIRASNRLSSASKTKTAPAIGALNATANPAPAPAASNARQFAQLCRKNFPI